MTFAPHVTTPAEAVVTPEQFGATGNNPNHDDTAGLQAAYDACVAAGGGVIVLSPKTYYANSAPRHDRAGNAIIALANENPTLGQGGPSVVFQGPVPQEDYWPTPGGGAVIETTRTTDAYSSTYGPPSIIGGPTPEQTTTMSVQQVGLKNVAVVAPNNPAIAGVDLGLITRVEIDGFAAMVNAPLSLGTSIAQPTNTWAFGLRMPLVSNYDKAKIDSGLSFGFYCGLVIGTEHTNIDQWVSAWCQLGVGLQATDTASSVPGWHATTVRQFQVEGFAYGIGGYAPASGVGALTGPFVLHADLLDFEDLASSASTNGWAQVVEHIHDPTNQLRGRVGVSRSSDTMKNYQNPKAIVPGLVTNGATRLKITELPIAGQPTTPDAGPNVISGRVLGNTPPIVVASSATAFGNAIQTNDTGNADDALGGGCIDFGTDPRLCPAGRSTYTFEFAYQALVLPSSHAHQLGGQWGQDANGLYNAFLVYLDSNGHVNLAAQNGFGSNVSIASGDTFNDTNRHPVAVTYSGGTLGLFVNGVLEGTVSAPNWYRPLGAPIRLGCDAQGAGYSNVAFDELRISSTARYGANYSPASAPFTSDNATLGLWHLDQLVAA